MEFVCRRHRELLAVLLVLCVVACGGEPLSEHAAVSARQEPPQSRAVLVVALDHFRASAQAPLRLDPRPLRADADPLRIREQSVDSGDSATIGLRTRLARELGVTVGDIVSDSRCLFSAGEPLPASVAPPPDSTRQRLAQCQAAGPFTTVAFGIPRPVAGDEAAAHPGSWKLRAQRITDYSLHTWDLYLRPTGSGWEVVDERRVFGISS